ALRGIPGFEYLVKKLMEIGFEQFFKITNLASNIQVRGKMLPNVRRILRETAEILNVPEPDLYVTTHPVPNSYTYGETRPFIVVTSGLLELFSEPEIMFVFAHELGHIKCGHVLYKTMARNFKMVLELASAATFGFSGMISAGLEMAIYDWERKSELSADRAGLIAVQSQRTANLAFMKLAAAAPKYYDDMDEAEFLRQIRSYEDSSDESFINKTYTAFITAKMSHPFTIMRAKHIDNWIKDGEYSKITGLDCA
ncbi:MAG: M48 family metallopeptidase, partial [Candidatus Riflebacteria bacterium]|nr:M48 family metallopeptidase [Candidatus Riflebacteria bacterium]